MLNILLLENDEFVQEFFQKSIDQHSVNLKKEKTSGYLKNQYIQEANAFDLFFINQFLEDGYYVVDFFEKNLEILKKNKIILLSPMSNFELFQYLLGIGVFEIIQKPYTINAILNLVKFQSNNQTIKQSNNQTIRQ